MISEKNKTIFITSFHILISRNILAMAVLPLLGQKGGLKIVILCPDRKAEFFRKEFNMPGVIIEPVKISSGWLDRLSRYFSLVSLKSHTMDLKRRTEMNGRGLFVSRFLPESLGMWKTRFMVRLFSSDSTFRQLLLKYKPDLVFATDVTNDSDVRLMREAKRLSIKTVGMVRSWDNLTAKGIIRFVPDRLLVNNQIIKREAVELHFVPADIISVVGVPHYDRYFESMKKPSVSDGSDSLPKNKYVLFAPAGDRYLSDNTTDREVVTILDRILPADFEIIVRLPPADSVKEIEKGGLPLRVRVFRPGGRFGDVKNTELSKKDDDVFIASLRNSNMVIVGPSTVVIDAAIFNKPVVMVGFDKGERPYLKGIGRYYDYDHFKPILESGGAPLARSVEGFEKLVKDYLANPDKDFEGRRRIVEKECEWSDGKSSQRLVEELEKFL